MPDPQNADLTVVLCTFPNIETAKSLAHQIVQQRLVACCNIVPGVVSVYQWKNELCEDQECLVVMKTTKSRYSNLQSFIEEHHPYDVPELVSLPVTACLDNYLSWVIKETS